MDRLHPHCPSPVISRRTTALLGLSLLALLALLSAVPATAEEKAPSVAPAPAATDPLALDKKILAEAKNGSEIMANLTYLSDVIGPRLTGSAALKRANEWPPTRCVPTG
jgi:hypothetical protein